MIYSKIVVKKFGGTSVGTIDRIHNVAKLVAEYKKMHPDTAVVVVVSAMTGETSKLIALAKQCVAEPSPRELDVMVATGEQVSIALMSMALHAQGLKAESMSGIQAHIVTNTSFTNAKIEEIDGTSIKAVVEQGIIPVIAGFQGTDPEGNITTLGRGGSDITAVAVAAALKANECFIYTDVEGVYTTDPRMCPEAKRMNRISHEEMLEMASLGAKVLHPRSVYFAMRYNVPMVVLSTFNPMQDGKILGTWIVPEEQLMEKPIVTGVTYRFDETKVSISDLKGGIQKIYEIFQKLSDDEVFVDMISQTVGGDGAQHLSFTVPTEQGKKAEEIVRKLEPTAKISLDSEIAKVSVVGMGMKYHVGVAAKAFEALALERIEVMVVATSEIKISVVVPRKYGELAVRALHKAFIENAPVVEEER